MNKKGITLIRFSILGIYMLLSSCFAGEIAKFEKLVFPVLTKTTLKSTKQSHGSSFVVHRDGQLITNYHVVKRVFRGGLRDKSKNLYVLINGVEYQAKILKFDVANDLALLKVPYKFESTVTISRVLPKLGDEVLSLGFHDVKYLSINQGRYNSVLKETANELMAISVPVNGGMSGGPLINESHEVVGVNVLKRTDKESAAYAINSLRLNQFLSKPNSADVEMDLKLQFQASLDKVNNELQSTKKHKNLGNWRIPNYEKVFTCGEYEHEWNFDRDEDDKNQNGVNENALLCRIDIRSIPLSSRSTIFNDFKFIFSNLKGKMNTRELTYYNMLNYKSKSNRRKFKFRSYDKFDCDNMTVRNSQQIPFKVAICIKKLKKKTTFLRNRKLYEFKIKFTSMMQGMDDLSGRIYFTGEKDLGKTLMVNMLEGIDFIPEKPEQNAAQRSLASEPEDIEQKEDNSNE